MVTNIPAALKAADVQRFVQRANQLERAKPIISYWCNYYALNQIVPKKLHLVNDETTAFTSDLMDKLEKAKSEIIDDAVSDDTVAHVYVEQFALETLQRGEDTMKANAVTKQTADTLSAAAAFIDACKIWGPLSEELAAKSIFAKFHAVRIAKALQAGEDPNATNPAPEPSPEEDVEMQDQSGQGALQQPYVEDVPDEHDNLEPRLARQSVNGQSLNPSRAPSAHPIPDTEPSPISPPNENYYHQVMKPEVSPLVSPDAEQKDFFPHAASMEQTPIPPQAPTPSAPAAPSANAFSSFPPPNIIPGQPSYEPPAPVSAPQMPSAPRYPTRQAAATAAAPRQQPQPTPRAPPPRPQAPPAQTYNDDGVYRTDDDAVMEATRHARFAVSALNFEDVKTAVKELQLALHTLGAR